MYMNSLVMSSYYIVASYDEGRQKARKGECTSDIQTEEDETKRPKRYVIIFELKSRLASLQY